MAFPPLGPSRSGYVSAPAWPCRATQLTYYAGMPEGGVWKTSNGGTTWKPIFDDVHVASVGAVAVAPSNPSVVYVGTGNQSGWSFTPGKGLHKSTDAGRTWTNVGLADSQYIGGIVVDPGNADRALVAVQGGRGGGAGAGAGVRCARCVSNQLDGGRAWTRVLPTDGSAGASDVYLDYGDPQVTYALLAGSGGPQPPSTGAYKSVDAGVTWTPVGGRGLPDGARISAFAVCVAALRPPALRGRRRGRWRTRRGRRQAGRALYRSDDGGESWIFGTRQLASAGGKIYADPQHPDVMYLMGTAVYRSTDAGQHVAAFWGAPSGADPRFLWIDPTNSKRILAGVDQGASVSVDGGESWTPYYGLVNGQFYRVATDYDFPYHVCGPQQDSGTACVPSRTDFGGLAIRRLGTRAADLARTGFLIADPARTRAVMHTRRAGITCSGGSIARRARSSCSISRRRRIDSRARRRWCSRRRIPALLYMAAQHVMASNDCGGDVACGQPGTLTRAGRRAAREPSGTARPVSGRAGSGAWRIDPGAGAARRHRRLYPDLVGTSAGRAQDTRVRAQELDERRRCRNLATGRRQHRRRVTRACRVSPLFRCSSRRRATPARLCLDGRLRRAAQWQETRAWARRRGRSQAVREDPRRPESALCRHRDDMRTCSPGSWRPLAVAATQFSRTPSSAT